MLILSQYHIFDPYTINIYSAVTEGPVTSWTGALKPATEGPTTEETPATAWTRERVWMPATAWPMARAWTPVTALTAAKAASLSTTRMSATAKKPAKEMLKNVGLKILKWQK